LAGIAAESEEQRVVARMVLAVVLPKTFLS
jgi:ethanolamine ammonia-lyase large subunit